MPFNKTLTSLNVPVELSLRANSARLEHTENHQARFYVYETF